jgi:hypothetical protein
MTEQYRFTRTANIPTWSYNGLQYSTVQYSTVQYSTVQYSTVLYHYQRPSEPRNRIAAVCIGPSNYCISGLG